MQRMLSELLPDQQIVRDVMISGLTEDSRQVKPGDLFLAAPGLNHDARAYIDEVLPVVAAIVCEAPCESDSDKVVAIDNLNEKKGDIAARFWGHPSQHMCVVAITGTNGKTSCAHYISQSLTLLGSKAGIMGTLGYGLSGAVSTASLTTPTALECQKQLAELLAMGAGTVALEASSHGLMQGRLNGVKIDIAVLTNITHDHLDYHETFSAYKAAKKKLFRWEGLREAVINFDDLSGQEFLEACGADTRVLTYSICNSDADVYCENVSYQLSGMCAELVTPWGNGMLASSLMGEFNLSNLMAVVAVLGSLNVDFEEILSVVKQLTNVKGRMEKIESRNIPLVVIDYAHTPDALEQVLKALRRHCDGQLWCVFGCGGNRDKSKRPAMAMAAESYSDHVVVTSDNPRDEEPQNIIDDILEGLREKSAALIEPDRAAAIRKVMESAQLNDLILIAGKGHEEYQERAGVRHYFSDHAEVRKFMEHSRRLRGN